jgi:hypothetical protein
MHMKTTASIISRLCALENMSRITQIKHRLFLECKVQTLRHETITAMAIHAQRNECPQNDTSTDDAFDRERERYTRMAGLAFFTSYFFHLFNSFFLCWCYACYSMFRMHNMSSRKPSLRVSVRFGLHMAVLLDIYRGKLIIFLFVH